MKFFNLPKTSHVDTSTAHENLALNMRFDELGPNTDGIPVEVVDIVDQVRYTSMLNRDHNGEFFITFKTDKNHLMPIKALADGTVLQYGYEFSSTKHHLRWRYISR